MRTTVPLMLAAAIGLAASLHAPFAKAGGLYVGLQVPTLVTAPLVTEVPVAPVAIVTDDDPTFIVTSGDCCWHGDDWHRHGRYEDGWHSGGWRGVRGRSAYEHRGNAPGPRGHEVARSGRR
ncbi:MAG TPA: hypothetical protein VNZ06_05385 [Steroidobacteraceae bacterium]|jgi:hypothetical protein|nr:hypothetical protein [Steroidobacteraceae bacterium]